MQETVKFSLKAKLAIIKKPDSNETYYTYNMPHKIMLLGMLGAIIGLNGYNYENFMNYIQNKKECLPEFYTKLNRIKIAIAPHFGEKGFNKKIQSFNNSVGYASQEEGNNLIVAEQILENPKWDVYILNDNSDEYNKIKEYLIHKKCEYIPYIGKNDYFADINNIEVLNTNLVKKATKINSIFSEDIIEREIPKYENVMAFLDDDIDLEYNFLEVLPTKLDEKLGYVDYKRFRYTNKEVEVKNNVQIYDVNGNNIYYF